MLILDDKKKLHTGEFSGIIVSIRISPLYWELRIMENPEGSNASSRMERHVEKGGQGSNDRKRESIAMRVKKKRTPKQLQASANESYGKFGSGNKKPRGGGKVNVTV